MMVAAHVHKGSWKRAQAELGRDITAAAEAVAQAQVDAFKANQAAYRKAEAERVRLTRDDIVGARFVRTVAGWHRVVTVNIKSVSVATGYSWHDRIEFDKVIEVRS